MSPAACANLSTGFQGNIQFMGFKKRFKQLPGIGVDLSHHVHAVI